MAVVNRKISLEVKWRNTSRKTRGQHCSSMQGNFGKQTINEGIMIQPLAKKPSCCASRNVTRPPISKSQCSLSPDSPIPVHDNNGVPLLRRCMMWRLLRRHELHAFVFKFGDPSVGHNPVAFFSIRLLVIDKLIRSGALDRSGTHRAETAGPAIFHCRFVWADQVATCDGPISQRFTDPWWLQDNVAFFVHLAFQNVEGIICWVIVVKGVVVRDVRHGVVGLRLVLPRKLCQRDAKVRVINDLNLPKEALVIQPILFGLFAFLWRARKGIGIVRLVLLAGLALALVLALLARVATLSTFATWYY